MAFKGTSYFTYEDVGEAFRTCESFTKKGFSDTLYELYGSRIEKGDSKEFFERQVDDIIGKIEKGEVDLCVGFGFDKKENQLMRDNFLLNINEDELNKAMLTRNFTINTSPHEILMYVPLKLEFNDNKLNNLTISKVVCEDYFLDSEQQRSFSEEFEFGIFPDVTVSRKSLEFMPHHNIPLKITMDGYNEGCILTDNSPTEIYAIDVAEEMDNYFDRKKDIINVLDYFEDRGLHCYCEADMNNENKLNINLVPKDIPDSKCTIEIYSDKNIWYNIVDELKESVESLEIIDNCYKGERNRADIISDFMDSMLRYDNFEYHRPRNTVVKTIIEGEKCGLSDLREKFEEISKNNVKKDVDLNI